MNIHARDVAAWIFMLNGAAVTINFGGENYALAFSAGLQRPPPGIASGGNGRHRGAMIRTIAGDNFRLAGEHARNLDRRLIGLGPRRCEEELHESFWKHLEQQL